MVAFLLTHLWQSTLIGLAAGALAHACRRNAAAVRYWIWFAASLKFLVPLALLQQLGDSVGRSLPAPLPVDAELVESATTLFVPSMSHSVVASHDLFSQLAIVAACVWALGAALLCLRWFLQWRSVRSLLACTPPTLMDGAPAPLRITSASLTTGVFGIFRPVVIMPRTLLQTLDASQLRTVLAHEGCHIRRGDNLTAAIHRCIEALFWFHPLVWWIGANLLRERETACDEAVIEEGHEQRAYAESILTACRLTVVGRCGPVAASTGGDLRQRLSSILSEQRVRPITSKRFAVLFSLATLVCFAPLAAGVTTGALREASDAGPITFDVISLKQAESRWWYSTRFEPESGRLVLKNFSLLQLIASAYPCSIVNDETNLIARERYDIEVRWRGATDMSERNLYRALLKQILQNNSNVEVHVTDLH